MRKCWWFLGSWCALVATSPGWPLRFNLSPSMPQGLYWRTHRIPKRGDIVAVCLPTAIAHYGLQHQFIHHGRCPSGIQPIVKQLIAVPGDRVSVTPDAMVVNDKIFMAHQAPQIKRFHAHSHGYWLYGANEIKKSWDSRYFGPVERTHITGVYTRIPSLPVFWSQLWRGKCDNSQPAALSGLMGVNTHDLIPLPQRVRSGSAHSPARAAGEDRIKC